MKDRRSIERCGNSYVVQVKLIKWSEILCVNSVTYVIRQQCAYF